MKRASGAEGTCVAALGAFVGECVWVARSVLKL